MTVAHSGNWEALGKVDQLTNRFYVCFIYPGLGDSDLIWQISIGWFVFVSQGNFEMACSGSGSDSDHAELCVSGSGT